MLTLLGDIACRQHIGRFDGLDGPVLANLEGAILPNGADEFRPRAKAGPHLSQIELPELAPGSCLTLANNHSMDYGEAGLRGTMAILENLGHHWCGAGPDHIASRKPLITTFDDCRVGIIAGADPQFGNAGRNHFGIADTGLWINQAIATLRNEVDFIIVSIHGGHEISPWPSPEQRQQYRQWAERGADVIHGHHAHVPQGYETHAGCLIAYGLGNALAPPNCWEDIQHSSWSLAFRIQPGAQPEALIIQNQFVDDQIVGTFKTLDACPEQQAYLNGVNELMAREDLTVALWQEIAVRSYAAYYRGWVETDGAHERIMPLRSRVKTSLKTLLGIQQHAPPPDKRQRALLYHLFVCNIHREAITTALGIHCGELVDDRNDETDAAIRHYCPWLYKHK